MIRLRVRRARPELRFEVIPLIDVMFSLLIFFVIFSSALAVYYQQKGMKLRLPIAASVTKEKQSAVLSVNQAGELFLDREAVDLASLRAKVTDLVAKNPQFQISIHADKEVAYEAVVQALDAVRLGGCFDVILQAQVKPHDLQKH